MNMIRIFCDVGVSFRSFVLLEKLLQRFFPDLSIRHISASELSSDSWIENTQILVFPGGRDQPYHEKLQGEANKQIRNFVAQGGLYFGICAGAYYAASDIEFEKGTSREIIETRELGFYPGTAKGTVYEHLEFSYETESGAHASRISTIYGSFYVYYNGGCCFLPSASTKHCDVLATYDDLAHGVQPAIVRCRFGDGMAVLSGVHLEFLPMFLNGNPSTKAIGQKVAQTYSVMDQFLLGIFKQVQTEKIVGTANLQAIRNF